MIRTVNENLFYSNFDLDAFKNSKKLVRSLDSNQTFRSISLEKYEGIKNFITSKYRITLSREKKPGLIESFDILYEEGIKVHYYKTGTLLFQSSPSNKTFRSLIEETANKFSLGEVNIPKKIPQAKLSSDFDFLIGCDEAGAGETFGSMFLVCSSFSKENLHTIQSFIDRKDIKEFSEYEITERFNKIKGHCMFYQKRYEAHQIDEGNKNTLLDRGYIELIKSATNGKQNLCVIIDDYRIKREMRLFLDQLKQNKHEVIVETKADENYTACQIASIAARKARYDEIKYLNKQHSIQDPISGKMLSPGSGNASNPNTRDYLEAYRRRYPNNELPSFVRKKWSNVRDLERKFSSRSLDEF